MGASMALITLFGTFVGPGSMTRYSMNAARARWPIFKSTQDVGFV